MFPETAVVTGSAGGIGRALVAQPKLMLLDEPSLGLAPKLIEDIFAIISRINKEQGVSMLLVPRPSAVSWRKKSAAREVMI